MRKPRDKPGGGIQSSITKFLQNVEESEGHRRDPGHLDPKGPQKLRTNGAGIKPRLATLRSSLTSRTPPKVGGNKGGGGLRDRKRSVRTLERWLLPLGSQSGHAGLEAADEDIEDKCGLEDRGREGNEDKGRVQ